MTDAYSSAQIFIKFFSLIRHRYGLALERKILNDSPDWQFRNELSQQVCPFFE